MRLLHTMFRISNIEKSLNFYCNLLGLQETRRIEVESGRFTLIFLAAPADFKAAQVEKAHEIELTWNWDGDTLAKSTNRNFGHLAYEVENIYEVCQRLKAGGVAINRPPRDGRMAFVRSPDGVSIELLQKGEALPPSAEWQTENIGEW